MHDGRASRRPARSDDLREPATNVIDLETRRAEKRSSAALTNVSRFVSDVLAEHVLGPNDRCEIDAVLLDDLPPVALDRAAVSALLDRLLRDASAAIGDEWGTVSISTGRVRNDVVFDSPTYPRRCLLDGLARGAYVYVEIHDTGAPRGLDLADGRALLRAHGGALRCDSDAGFGTRVLLLFPC